MSKVKRLFGEINLTWLRLIIFSVIAGVYTAIMAIIPATRNTSFRDITTTFEVWILFGILIIMNSKSAIDSALKCFVFFLISQPLVYLIQVPFNSMGFGLFHYYKRWFIWTLLTFPMGFIGYFMKKDKWWGLLILTPVLLLLGTQFIYYMRETIFGFPLHSLTTLFCMITLLLYPLCIFNNKKIKIAGVIISTIIILVMAIMSFTNRLVYNIKISSIIDANLNEKCSAYLENDSMGKVNVEYDKNFEGYVVNASFIRGGKTDLIVVDENGNKTAYELNVSSSTYSISKK